MYFILNSFENHLMQMPLNTIWRSIRAVSICMSILSLNTKGLINLNFNENVLFTALFITLHNYLNDFFKWKLLITSASAQGDDISYCMSYLIGVGLHQIRIAQSSFEVIESVIQVFYDVFLCHSASKQAWFRVWLKIH